jgi:hypothetical protein
MQRKLEKGKFKHINCSKFFIFLIQLIVVSYIQYDNDKKNEKGNYWSILNSNLLTYHVFFPLKYHKY